MNVDYGKIIGSAIAAGLLALQLGMDVKLETHEEVTEKAVDRIEDNTMHKSTVEKHLAAVESRFERVESDFMPKSDIQDKFTQFDSEDERLNQRLLILEREMNSVYQGLDGE